MSIRVNPWRKLSRICLFARIAHSPNRVRPIIAYQQRSIRGLGHPYRTPPYIAIRQHKSSQEIFILPRGISRLMQGNRESLHIPRAHPCSTIHVRTQKYRPGTPPGTCRPIKRNLERSIVRLQQHIRHNRLIFQLRMLSLVPRILVRPHVPPRPAIKSAFLHMRDVIRTRLSPNASRSFTEHHNSPVFGLTSIPPPAFRIPTHTLLQLAIHRIEPRISARSSLLGCVSGSSTFDPEPTATNIFFAVGREFNRLACQCPPGGKSAMMLRLCRSPSDRHCDTETAPIRFLPNINPLRHLGPGDRTRCHKGASAAAAKIAVCSGLPSAVIPRNTRIRPGSISARKTSPFGAVRTSRGLSSPDWYNIPP